MGELPNLPPDVVDAVLRRAAELDVSPPTPGLSHDDVQRIAAEAGISAGSVREALAEARKLGIDNTTGPNDRSPTSALTTHSIEELVRRQVGEKRWVKDKARDLATVVGPDERLLDAAAVTPHGGVRKGLLAVTDRRVLFVRGSGSKQKLVDVPLPQVSTVSTKTGRWGAQMRIGSTYDGMVFASADSDAVARVADLVRRLTQSEPDRAPLDQTMLDRLKQLGELRDSGVLTDEEFTSEKAKLLKR